MADIFPFQLPFPTAFYLVLYLATLIGHVLFMNYVLAGCCYLAFVNLFPGRAPTPRHKQPIADVLSDWMPFAISAAITMGVAPLLFVQIVYKERFYSANLLLSHRWMIMLPVLILGFYLVYVVRSWRTRESSPATRMLVVILAAACFLFAAWSWTENHLLGLDRESWPAFYAADEFRYQTRELLPRLVLWVVGAFPTMALLAAWQLKRHASAHEPAGGSGARDLSRIAILGLVLVVVAAGWYYATVNRVVSTPNEVAPLAGLNASIVLYLALALLGLVLQCIGWVRIRRAASMATAPLAAPTFGLWLTLTGVTVIRELYRLSRVDITALFTEHAERFDSGGFRVFLVVAAINVAVIVCCISVVARSVGARQRRTTKS